MTRLCDAHLHLQDRRFPDALRQEGLPGIRAQVINGTRPDDWAAVDAIPDTHDTRRYKAYGVHPWHVAGLPDDWDARLVAYLRAGAVSVGEIGLDQWISPRDEVLQKAVFRRQLAIAKELELPPTIHCIRAWEPLIACLKEFAPFPRGLLIHAFAGSVELLNACLKFGAYFSFSGYAADPQRKRMRAAIAACPPSRLLLETDAPDMLPPPTVRKFPLQGAGSELHHPAELATACEIVATIREVQPAAIAQLSGENFFHLFRCEPPSPASATLRQKD